MLAKIIKEWHKSRKIAKCNNIIIKVYNWLFYLFGEIFCCLNGGFALKISLMHHLLHFA